MPSANRRPTSPGGAPRRRWHLAGIVLCGASLSVVSPTAANAPAGPLAVALTAATVVLSVALLACAALAEHATERMYRRR